MANLKRNLDDNGTVDDGIKKIRTDAEGKVIEDAMEIRVLINNYEASVVIGKGGSNVKSIRTDSNSFVSIRKPDSTDTKERVMTVKGSEECIAKAMQLIFTLLLESANHRKSNDPKENGEPDSTYTMKILIHKFLAGSIIGKGGSIMKEIQEATQCRLSVSAEPLANSTEKTVSITGTPECFYGGCVRVLTQLAANPLRANSATISYVPGQVSDTASAAPPAFNPYLAVQQSPYSAPYGVAYGAPPTPVSTGPTKTEKIVIPTVCAGTVIGKGGSIIRDIKSQSSTTIAIADAEPTAPDDRVLSVTGTHQGIQTAIYLIRQRVESYQPPTVGAM